MSSPASHKRNKVLIRPRLQLRIVLAFISAACISAIVQVLLLTHRLSSLAGSLPTDGSLLLEELPGILRSQLLLTFLLMAPLLLVVGVMETFRIVGPLWRIERYLKDIVEGRRPGPCRVRDTDDLQDLCRLLNDATQPLLHPASDSLAQAAQDGPTPAAPRPVVGDPSAERVPDAA